MQELLSTRIKNLKPSATIAMAAKARELKSQGKDIISLSLGEPDFETPDFIKQAAIQAIKDNYNSYTPVGGFPDLRESICNKFKRDNNIHYTAQQVVVSTGAKQSIYQIIQCLVNEGDEVIVPAPYWVSYFDIIRLSGGKPVVLNTDLQTDYKITPQQLEAAITPKTKAIIYSSPCNPSGSVFTHQELEALANILAKHPNIIIISDEIYEHIVYDTKPPSMASFPQVYNQTVTVNGLAKGFAMTGWRIGYIGAPLWLAKACETLQGQITSGTNAVAQRAAITALDADPSQIQYMVDAFADRRKQVIEWAEQIPYFMVNQPKGAFYLFPDISQAFGKEYNNHKINSASDVSLYLLEQANVATVTGDAFGAPNCIRLSYAASIEQLKEAFDRIKVAMEKLG